MYDEVLIARAWHDVTCPEGPACRDRLLHSAAQPVAYTGVAGRFMERYRDLEDQWLVAQERPTSKP